MSDIKTQTALYNDTLGRLLEAGGILPHREADALLGLDPAALAHRHNPALAVTQFAGGNSALSDAAAGGKGWLARKLLVSAIIHADPGLKKAFDAQRAGAIKDSEPSATGRMNAAMRAEEAFLSDLKDKKFTPDKQLKDVLEGSRTGGFTALRHAAYGNPDLMEHLLNAGVRPGDVDGKGNNLLHSIAACNTLPPEKTLRLLRRPEYARMLDEENKEGKIPFELATHTEMRTLLQSGLHPFDYASKDPAHTHRSVTLLREASETYSSHLFSLAPISHRPRQGPATEEEIQRAVQHAQKHMPAARDDFARILETVVSRMEADVDYRPRRPDVREILAQAYDYRAFAPEHPHKDINAMHTLYKSVPLPAAIKRFEAVCEKQDAAFLEQVLKTQGEALKKPDAEGNAPLYYAMRHRRWKEAETLIEKGAPLGDLTKEKANAYHLVAQYADETFPDSLRKRLIAHPEKEMLINAPLDAPEEHKRRAPVTFVTSAQTLEFFLDAAPKTDLFLEESGGKTNAEHWWFTLRDDCTPEANLGLLETALKRIPDPIAALTSKNMEKMLDAVAGHSFKTPQENARRTEALKRLTALAVEQQKAFLQTDAAGEDGAYHPSQLIIQGILNHSLCRGSPDTALFKEVSPALKLLREPGRHPFPMHKHVHTFHHYVACAESGDKEAVKQLMDLHFDPQNTGDLIHQLNDYHHDLPPEGPQRKRMEAGIDAFIAEAVQRKGIIAVTEESPTLPVHSAISRYDVEGMKRLIKHDWVHPAPDKDGIRHYGESGTPVEFMMAQYAENPEAPDSPEQAAVKKEITALLLNYEAGRAQNAAPRSLPNIPHSPQPGVKGLPRP